MPNNTHLHSWSNTYIVSNYFAQNGDQFKMLSDPSGSTKSRSLEDGSIKYPDFDEIVEIDDDEATQ